MSNSATLELGFRRGREKDERTWGPGSDGEARVGVGAFDVRDGVVAVEESPEKLDDGEAADDLQPHGGKCLNKRKLDPINRGEGFDA